MSTSVYNTCCNWLWFAYDTCFSTGAAGSSIYDDLSVLQKVIVLCDTMFLGLPASHIIPLSLCSWCKIWRGSYRSMNTLQATVSLSRNQQPHRSVSEPLYIALSLTLVRPFYCLVEPDIAGCPRGLPGGCVFREHDLAHVTIRGWAHAVT